VSGNVGEPEKEGFSGQQFSEALLVSVSEEFCATTASLHHH
jgi:hypothetical protein